MRCHNLFNTMHSLKHFVASLYNAPRLCVVHELLRLISQEELLLDASSDLPARYSAAGQSPV